MERKLAVLTEGGRIVDHIDLGVIITTVLLNRMRSLFRRLPPSYSVENQSINAFVYCALHDHQACIPWRIE